MQRLKTLVSQIPHEGHRFIRGVVWNMAGNFISKIVLLVASVLIARWVGVEDFGRWGVTRSTMAMFVIVLGFGLGVTAMKYIGEFRKSSPEKAGRFLSLNIALALVIGGGLSVVMYLLSPFLARRVFNDASLATIFKISSVFLFLNGMTGVVEGALSGLERFRGWAFANVVSTTSGGGVLLVLSYQWGLYGVVWGYAILYTMILLSEGYYLLKVLSEEKIPLTFDGIWQESDVLVKFSLPAIISGAIGGPVIWLVMTYVSNLENGFAIIGVYTAANIGQNIVVQFGSQLNVPMAAILFNSKNSAVASKINMLSSWVTVSILALPLLCLPELGTWMFNKGGYQGTDLNQSISLSMIVAYIMIYKHSYGRAIVKHNRVWWGVYENIFWGTCLYFLVRLFSGYKATGLTGAFACAYLIDLLVITPFYIRGKLISRVFVYSKPALLIWCIILSALALVMFNIPWQVRAMYFFVAVPSLVGCFLQLNRRFDSMHFQDC